MVEWHWVGGETGCVGVVGGVNKGGKAHTLSAE